MTEHLDSTTAAATATQPSIIPGTSPPTTPATNMRRPRGGVQKYFTDADRAEARRLAALEGYYRNREQRLQRRREAYAKKKAAEGKTVIPKLHRAPLEAAPQDLIERIEQLRLEVRTRSKAIGAHTSPGGPGDFDTPCHHFKSEAAGISPPRIYE